MAKRISKSKKADEKSTGTGRSQPQQPKQNEQQEKSDWDFGGIPERDMKRNLGCG